MGKLTGKYAVVTRIKATPAQRLAPPSALAAAVSFLASDDSCWVTGDTLLCCGGARMRD